MKNIFRKENETLINVVIMIVAFVVEMVYAHYFYGYNVIQSIAAASLVSVVCRYLLGDIVADHLR